MNVISGMLKYLYRCVQNSQQVLSMNRRNLNYIYPHNARADYPIADDKVRTKRLLQRAGVPLAKTHIVYEHFYQLRHLPRDLSALNEFVIKPASGSRGGGIVVLAEKRDDHWLTLNGTIYNHERLRKHISDILFGVYSLGLQDSAIVESRVRQHDSLARLSPHGLADVRIIVFRGQAVMAMLRLTTAASKGRANIHQGAIGVGLDMSSGTTREAILHGRAILRHPDNGTPLNGVPVPHWRFVMDTALKTAAVVPLEYIGVDIAIADQGPLVLEINARPGIEIQNANREGLRGRLASFAS